MPDGGEAGEGELGASGSQVHERGSLGFGALALVGGQLDGIEPAGEGTEGGRSRTNGTRMARGPIVGLRRCCLGCARHRR